MLNNLKEFEEEIILLLSEEDLYEEYWKYEEMKEYKKLERYFNDKLNAYMMQVINNQVKVFLKQVKYDTEYTRVKTEIDEVVDEILDLLIA